MSSSALSSAYVSQVVGWLLTKGQFNNSTPNLPQRIVILGEANKANQSGLDLTPLEITSADVAGQNYGYGSPIHMVSRILRPKSGEGVGGVPVFAYPQASSGATAKVMEVTPAGTATGNGTHTLVIAGREGIDGDRYDFTIATGDTAADIATKITDAVNNVVACPVSANDSTYSSILTSKWEGETADDLTLSVLTNGNDLGISYVVEDDVQSGAGTPSISAALDLFGETWNTIVINTYGTNSGIMDTLEAFNGIPDPNNPTGRYSAIAWLPFVALTGTTADDPSAISDARKDEVTIALCPAPGSAAHPMEAAANMAVLYAPNAQDTPQKEIINQKYPDMPIPSSGNIGSMGIYTNRNAFVKKGCSTVALSGGSYQVKDFVTTYHPTGENPPFYRYVRDLNVHYNIRYAYFLKEAAFVVGKTLAGDDDEVTATGVIKPKDWANIVNNMLADLVDRGLVTDQAFSTESLVVNISSANPNRFETFFRVKITGIARLSSTTAEAGFNFG